MKSNEILNNQSQERPLEVKEACEFLKVSKSHLYKLTHKRMIPFFKPNGKKIYFLKSDLLNWMLRNPIRSISDIEQEAIDYVVLNQRKS